MKNSPATFQRLVNKVISGLGGVGAYIDDVIIYSDIWEEHLRFIRSFCDRLSEFQLTVNQVKPIFTKYFILIIICVALLDICLYVVKRNLSSFKLSFSLTREVLLFMRTGWGPTGVLVVLILFCVCVCVFFFFFFSLSWKKVFFFFVKFQFFKRPHSVFVKISLDS